MAELGIILIAFKLLLGTEAAIIMGCFYIGWNLIKTITAYRMMKKITLGVIKNGCKRTKK
jgi:hypothetical protein